MINSFNSWARLNEAIASGREVMTDPTTGKRHKVTYRVQTSHKFVMKVVHDADLLDETGKLTEGAMNGIIEYLNSEVPFTRSVAELSPAFFGKNFIVYTVVADGTLFNKTKQKIQFEVVERAEGLPGLAGYKPKYPNIPDTVRFIDADSFNALSKLAPPIVAKLKQDAQAAQLPDPKPEATPAPTPVKKEEAPTPTKELGKRFLYTMRTNSKLYGMEFTSANTLSAKTEDGSDPNGSVSYDAQSKKVMWSTSLDDANSKESRAQSNVGTPLFSDSEITNPQDKSFFEKIFTDEAFKRKIIEEYEAEYGGSEMDPTNLKKMLFFKDGTPMFPTQTKASAATTSTETASEPTSGADMIAKAKNHLKDVEKSLTAMIPGTSSES